MPSTLCTGPKSGCDFSSHYSSRKEVLEHPVFVGYIYRTPPPARPYSPLISHQHHLVSRAKSGAIQSMLSRLLEPPIAGGHQSHSSESICANWISIRILATERSGIHTPSSVGLMNRVNNKSKKSGMNAKKSNWGAIQCSSKPPSKPPNTPPLGPASALIDAA